MNIVLRNVQYHLGAEAVAMLLEHPFGSFYVNTTQSALMALAPQGATTWSDDQAMIVAQEAVDTDERFAGLSPVVVIHTPPEPG